MNFTGIHQVNMKPVKFCKDCKYHSYESNSHYCLHTKSIETIKPTTTYLIYGPIKVQLSCQAARRRVNILDWLSLGVYST